MTFSADLLIFIHDTTVGKRSIFWKLSSVQGMDGEMREMLLDKGKGVSEMQMAFSNAIIN